VFLSELLQEAWLRREQTIDTLRADVDSSGYDLVLQCGTVCRYIQLKSCKLGASTKSQTLNVKLAQKPGGSVIWMFADTSTGSVELVYRFLGGAPSECLDLGDKIPRRATANADGVKPERHNMRTVGIGKFDKPVCVAGLFDKLFPSPTPNA